MPMSEPPVTATITIRQTEVGRLTPEGRYLHATAFRALPRHTDRVAAYLALVWPGMRRTRTIALVCGFDPHTIGSYVNPLLQAGSVRRVGRGRYVLVRHEEGQS